MNYERNFTIYQLDCLKNSTTSMALMKWNGYKRNQLYWYFLSTNLHPLIWIFKRFWCPKWFWEFFCHKKSTLLNHFYLKYALIDWKLSCQMATLFLNDLQAERFHFIYWHVCRPTSCCFVHETAVKLILILIQFLLLYVSRLEVLFQ